MKSSPIAKWLVLLAVLSLVSPAHALSVLNADAEDVILVVTDDGVRTEVTVAPNATVTVCANGCFVSLSGGEIAAFNGSEEISIQKGKIRILKN